MVLSCHRRHAALAAVCLAMVLLGWPAAADAQPGGSVTFSGPGASMLPSTTFVPDVFQGTPESWIFTNVGDGVTILVTLHSTDPTTAALVSVGVDSGASWLAFGLIGVPGVVIAENTVTFTNVDVPQAARGATNLIMNGTLTRPTTPVEPTTWGVLKTIHR